MAHGNSLKSALLKPCLLETTAACPKVVDALRSHGFPSAESALTGRFLRVQGKTTAAGDVVLYKSHNKLQVGELDFIASLGGEIVVCLSHWPVQEKTDHWKKVMVTNEFTIVPAACILQSLIFTPTNVGKIATVLMPALY